MLPPHLAQEAAADLGAEWADAAAYDAHRIALGVPRGGMDFIYGDAFPHEADMDQLHASISTRVLHRPGGGVRASNTAAVRETVSCHSSPTAASRPTPACRGRGRASDRRYRLVAGPRGLAMLRSIASRSVGGRHPHHGGRHCDHAGAAEWRSFHGRKTRPPNDYGSSPPDGLHRCPWPDPGDTLYVGYHDTEWGVPEYDDRALYEKLVLDGFQAACPGSPSCASARTSAAPSTASIRQKSRATTRAGRSSCE